jgi:hypothetical protein
MLDAIAKHRRKPMGQQPTIEFSGDGALADEAIRALATLLIAVSDSSSSAPLAAPGHQQGKIQQRVAAGGG